VKPNSTSAGPPELRKHQELTQANVLRATSRKRRQTAHAFRRKPRRAVSERDQAFKGLVSVSINVAMVIVQVVANVRA
jgi:hypothetical protein